MKKLNITKEQFNRSRYFKNKYGKLEYVSESGKLFKTSKGNVLKFNESDDENVNAVQDAYDKYRACSTEPKICHAVKINDDGTEEKIGISMTRGNSIGGIAKAIRDGRLRKVLKFSESSKPKFVKESASDIANDPAYECPYCGSHDCEFEDAEEIGTGMTEGYFDGATFNAQFWCKECEKPYNVTFELKVANVYPSDEDEYPFEESTKVNESSFQVLDSDGETTTLSRECPFCHKEHHITIDMGEDEFYDRYDAMRAGELIQNAFPTLDPNQREFIKTGICDTCWDSL